MTEETSAPWRDKGTLRQKYWVEGKSLTETGDELGCSRSCVRKWLQKHDLGTRASPGDENALYRDADLLEKLYWGENLSTVQIASKLGCNKQTVLKWMERYGIQRRKSYHDKNGCFFTDKQGYEHFAVTHNYETTNVRLHRLLAVAIGEIAPSEFSNGQLDIHHENGIPWDNRPGNIQALTVSEHAKEHAPERNRTELGDFA